MNNVSDPLTVLRTLDPAPRSVDAQSPRARADLARILATHPGSQAEPPRRLATGPRLAIAAATVLGLGTGLALVPPLTAGDPAFATWAAEPTSLSASESVRTAEACRDSQRDGAGTAYRQALASATTAIAERRGAWTLALLTGGNGFSALCITDESRPVFQSSFGYVGERTGNAGNAPGALLADTLGVGAIGGHELSVAVGPIDSDVTAMTYESDEHGTVAATVSGGHYAFWLPGDELEDAPQDGAQVDVTYRDGSTETRTVTLG